MNAHSHLIELLVERSQLEESLLSIFHTILLHRSMGKFDYKQEKTFSVGTIGTDDVDCEFLDLTYVRISSKTLDAVIRKRIADFRDQLQEHSQNGIAIGTITLEFFQKKRRQWIFTEDRVAWEVWNLHVTERVLSGQNEKKILRDTAAALLADKIASVVETIGRLDFTPKMPEMTEESCVFDTTLPDIQPYLFRIYSNFGNARPTSVGRAVRRFLNENAIN